MAKLHFIYGVMSSSKSLRLLATAHDFDEKNIPILVIKPSADTRDGEGIIK
jgi:thymidine kinase